MEINPLHPLFAAELIGADLSSEPDQALVDFVEEAMAQHAVLVIRGQSHIDDADHIRFSRAFGPLELPHGTRSDGAAPRKRISPLLYDASNLRLDGEIMAPDDKAVANNKGNELFHMDSSFHAMPTKWSLLLGHSVTSEGGETELVDTRAVYDALPEDLRSRIDGRIAEHNVWISRQRIGFEGTLALKEMYPAVTHDIVGLSASGRKCLVIGSHADHIIGMDEAEGRALLDALVAFASQPQFIYSHRWQQGDLLIWDNRCTLHRARPFDYFGVKRDLRRSTICEYGEEMSAIEARRT
ncbi:alpha-ketoglutarate-dependent 2,4-dichlorophenoxyacetate dioxygenase [Sphingobium sp. B11D3B]|uniref:TauD/TfdA dioxygenase family protein n=1 Tax=unclassified Sphingobium TaxID=2611147 RepID=UPI0022249851|nr:MULTISPECIES: TauD/TfdA family dioxygenase [unclassified Sphingobium]MCW2365100.1 alpha-ketoglutarate-dependent 2,4-dichlorophenoxyacetate dioxygenase [Sphingobium sp. B7D2B]MCW2389267.1 alpha-ketoglutarate-dependent 2,4-dichlorophenoxyacetate dioxygenase [Sphingobium sp. B11D3B]